jgi:UDP-N-acetylglucosamine 2-epimerase (non-hydrolysing)
MKLLHVVGARPNFPKLAPVYRAAQAHGLQQLVVHTGQHYDDAMSADFFRDLGLPAPDLNLSVGSASHAVQTARIMERVEPVLLEHRPDWVVVYGDVNSTVAAVLVAVKLGIRTAHVEAGLRSGDRRMPEEINRLVTDRLADLLLTPSRDADETLRAEGVPDGAIAFVGNVMIDSLHYALGRLRSSGRLPESPAEQRPVVVTLHRPSNVDDPGRMAAIVRALATIAERRRVVFPMHPRTAAVIREAGLDAGAVELRGPMAYPDMLALVNDAHVVITDSGGLQEETTALGIPCLTVRENTERPITVSEGTNRLAFDPSALPGLVEQAERPLDPPRPEGWDGRAGERVVAALLGVHVPAGAGTPADAQFTIPAR